MAIGWLTVLKMVPWGDVIANAPKIADGAMQLWSTVARKPVAAVSPAENMRAEASSEAHALRAQLVAAEARINDLHNQMLESSELIKALADQSAVLIKRIEINRIRVIWLFSAVVVLAVMITVNLAIMFSN